MLLPGLVPIVWGFFFLVIELLQETRREIEKDVPTDEISYLTKDQRVQTSNAEMNSQKSPPPFFGLAG